MTKRELRRERWDLGLGCVLVLLGLAAMPVLFLVSFMLHQCGAGAPSWAAVCDALNL